MESKLPLMVEKADIKLRLLARRCPDCGAQLVPGEAVPVLTVDQYIADAWDLLWLCTGCRRMEVYEDEDCSCDGI